MSLINNIYSYPRLERLDLKNGRYYLDSNNNPVPSVTTVLSKTSKSSIQIDQWRTRVGNEEADRIIKQSTDIGTMVHEALENYLNNKNWNNFSSNNDGQIAKNISNKFIDSGLDRINEIWGLEAGLMLDNLYAGTADCIGIFNGVSSIIDFKTSKKIKKREWIGDYFLQGCAYANAHNVMFETNIKQVVILMVDRDLTFKEFVVGPSEFNSITNDWKNRLKKFHNLFKNE
jgi:genome maintenance exonuclease 1